MTKLTLYRRSLRLFAPLLCLLAMPALAQQSAVVGEVSLVLGKAYRYQADGSRETIARGTQIAVQDTIATESNGHVHIRFIDDALVSVRPHSELEVVRYEFDAAQPEESAVKFNLREGVTRAISGEAAKSARDRFRLNTPIAAIGVRGTDFVVSADADTTRALVNEGIIVMAPFGDACSMDALGPCLANALELAGSTLQMVAMDQNAPLPRLLPAQNIRNPNMMREEVQQAIAAVERSPADPGTSVAAGAESEQETQNEVLLEGATNNAVTKDAEQAIVIALTPPDFTPSSPVSISSIGNRKLVWGRYADTASGTDPLALPYELATAGREITVGTLEFGLFRAEGGAPKRVASDLGLVGFQLNSAQAVYNSDTGVVAMQVNGGTLDINFPEGAFATELNLNHELTGAVDITASGRLFDGGFLRAIEETQRVSGAVSLDGSEAGYRFERQLENGDISGLTLWDSQ